MKPKEFHCKIQKDKKKKKSIGHGIHMCIQSISEPNTYLVQVQLPVKLPMHHRGSTTSNQFDGGSINY